MPTKQINCLVAPNILPTSQKTTISSPILLKKQTLLPLLLKPKKQISPYDINEGLKHCCPILIQSYRTWKGHKNGKATFKYNSSSCRTRVLINCTYVNLISFLFIKLLLNKAILLNFIVNKFEESLQ